MPSLSALSDYKTYHILSYGTFLGATFFQSFINGIVAYKALPRPQFARLQQMLTPVFFTMQSTLAVVLAITYPGQKLLQAGGESVRSRSGIGGILASSNRWTVLAPLATILLTSVANMVALGPATTKAMKDRHHQETRDGKKYMDAGPQSTEMQRLNKLFGTLHSVSTILDLAGFGAAIYYGLVIAEGV